MMLNFVIKIGIQYEHDMMEAEAQRHKQMTDIISKIRRKIEKIYTKFTN